MSKHTPGPWWVTRGRDVRAHKPSGSPVVLDTVGICEVYSGGAGIDGADANALLIAAAPDLLEALEELLAVAPHKPPGAGMIEGIEFRHAEALKRARAVIAKAKGEA